MGSMIDAIKWVTDNHLEGEALKLANIVGDIYTACAMMYLKIPQTSETIGICQDISKQRHNGYWKSLEEVREDLRTENRRNDYRRSER